MVSYLEKREENAINNETYIKILEKLWTKIKKFHPRGVYDVIKSLQINLRLMKDAVKEKGNASVQSL